MMPYYKSLINRKITQEKSIDLSLDEVLLSGNSVNQRDYETTYKLIIGALFAPNIQEYKKRIEQLSRSWHTPVNVWTLKEENLFYVYIGFNRLEKYIFVTKFEDDSPSEEVKKKTRNIRDSKIIKIL